MIARILTVLAVIAACAAVLYAIVWGYETWRDGKVAEGDRAGAARVQAQWDADKVKRAGEKDAAVAAARADEQGKADAAVKGERDARLKAEQQVARYRDAAGRSAAAAGGLSGHIADLDRAARAIDLPAAAACPGEFVKQRDAAIRARAVLNACQQEYRSLAAAADDAIGTITLRLDTALSYIAAVAPKTP